MFVYNQSLQGKRHLQKGVPCQDKCGYCITPNNWIVGVAADGVSASPLSETGASIAVESCLQYFSDFKFSPYLDEDGILLILRDAFNYALRCIKDSDSPDSFVPFSKMTTLQAFIYHEKNGLYWGQAGDGALIIRNTKGNWKRLTHAMKNKEDDNSPITLQDKPEDWQFGSIRPEGLESILLTTDGVGDVIGDGTGNKEICDAVISFLMDPPLADLNEQTADLYYRRLFIDPNTETRKNEAADTALFQLAAITDDITVLLIKDLADSKVTYSAAPCNPNNLSGNLSAIQSNTPEGNVSPQTTNPMQKSHDHQNTFNNPEKQIKTTQQPNEYQTPEPVRRRNNPQANYSYSVKNKSTLESIFQRFLSSKSKLLLLLLVVALLLVLICSKLLNKPSDGTQNVIETNVVQTETVTPAASDATATPSYSPESEPVVAPAVEESLAPASDFPVKETPDEQTPSKTISNDPNSEEPKPMDNKPTDEGLQIIEEQEPAASESEDSDTQQDDIILSSEKSQFLVSLTNTKELFPFFVVI